MSWSCGWSAVQITLVSRLSDKQLISFLRQHVFGTFWLHRLQQRMLFSLPSRKQEEVLLSWIDFLKNGSCDEFLFIPFFSLDLCLISFYSGSNTKLVLCCSKSLLSSWLKFRLVSLWSRLLYLSTGACFRKLCLLESRDRS